MASFTFAAGNARGLRRLPVYALGALATWLVPRSDRIWAFGSGIGPGEGALPLLRLAHTQLGEDTRLVWLASSTDELARARALGLDAELKQSRRGWWLTMRARVLVVTHGLGDVNRFGSRGGFVVQLWHGIPLKRLHLDAPVAMSAEGRARRALVRFGYHAVGRQIDLFPVSSQLVVPRIVSAFGVTAAKVAVTGDPRDDVLLQGTRESRRADARALLAAAFGPLPTGPVIMYAPTWRDGGIDPAAPDDATWDAIVAWLDEVDGLLIMRSHHLGQGDYAGGPARSDRVRLLDATMLADVTPALAAVDHLVTDYSSTAFDFSLVGETTVFLAADIDAYLASRGLYEPYERITGGRSVVSWTHALELLDQRVRPRTVEDRLAAEDARVHQQWIRDEHFDHLDGRATARVLAEIGRRLAIGVGVGAETANRPAARAAVTSVRIEATELVLTLRGDVQALRLDGPRGSIAARLTRPGDRVTAHFDLLATRWGVPGLARPSGTYRLTLVPPDAGLETTRVDVDATAVVVVTSLFRARAGADAGGFVLELGAPLTDAERSGQRRLRLRYATSRAPLENAIYFESFYGRAACDNPLGIDRVIARDHPEITRYWSVTDRSVAVPAGAVPLVEYSRQWWQVRATARLYVINDWLRWTYRPRRGQHVLQTWHGTMLKRLALDRPARNPRRNFAVKRQSWRWTALLAQNAYSAAIFRRAYAMRGPIWETGYPRNDVLADVARAATVRADLGLTEGTRIVLYAPTWRDDRTTIVDHLDLDRLAAELPEHMLLVRGHTRTLGHGADLSHESVVDVTSYPDMADLMLIADVLITDYSSVMFDFAATGKPMIFFTPDVEHYVGNLRGGFYFDLVQDAPGPVVRTLEDVVAAVRDVATNETVYAQRYAAWREKFTLHDDGRAGERVVQRLFDQGWLG